MRTAGRGGGSNYSSRSASYSLRSSVSFAKCSFNVLRLRWAPRNWMMPHTVAVPGDGRRHARMRRPRMVSSVATAPMAAMARPLRRSSETVSRWATSWAPGGGDASKARLNLGLGEVFHFHAIFDLGPGTRGAG